MEDSEFWIRWPDHMLGGMYPCLRLEKVSQLAKLKHKIGEAIAKQDVTYIGSPRDMTAPGRRTPPYIQVGCFRKDLMDTPFAELNKRLAGCQIYEHISDVPLPPI